MASQDSEGFVYILTNDAMPGLCKIGLTKDPVQERMGQLYKTGVPLPFDCFFVVKVQSMKKVEDGLHKGLRKFRLNPNREFFQIEPADAQAILSLLGEDVTPREDLASAIEPADFRRSKNTSKVSFSKLGIAVGETLLFAKDESVTAQVADDANVNFKGEVTSLSQAALVALRDAGYLWKSARGPAFWLYGESSIASLMDQEES